MPSPLRFGRWFAFVGFVVSTAFAAPAIRFADVRPGDKLEVYYSASGCFASERAEFFYSSQGQGSFDVTEYVRVDDALSRWQPLNRGAVVLEPGDIAKLDLLLARYRTPPPPDHIQLTGPMIPSLELRLRRNGHVVAQEQLTEKWPPGDGVLTFGEMLQALRLHARR